ADVGGGVLLHHFHEKVQRLRLDERLVSLEVDHDVRIELAGDLGDAIRTAGVVVARHHDVAAKAVDRGDNTRVVGGDNDFAGAPRLQRPLVDVLDKVLAALTQQRFAGQT